MRFAGGFYTSSADASTVVGGAVAGFAQTGPDILAGPRSKAFAESAARRPDWTASSVSQLHAEGLKIVMLTGDNSRTEEAGAR